MDASEFLGLRATHNPVRWYLDVVPGICTDDQFLFGGCGLGAAIAALERTTGRPAVWAVAQYLSFAHPPEIVDIDVTVASAGHQTTQARAVAHVGDREILTVNAALGERDGGYDGQWARFPDVPMPDDCPPRQRISRVDDSLAQRLEMRLARGRDLAALDGVPDDGHSARSGRGSRLGSRCRPPRWRSWVTTCPSAIAQALGQFVTGSSLDNTLRVVHAGAHRVGAHRRARPRHRPRVRSRPRGAVGRGRHAARHREPVVRRAAAHGNRRSDLGVRTPCSTSRTRRRSRVRGEAGAGNGDGTQHRRHRFRMTDPYHVGLHQFWDRPHPRANESARSRPAPVAGARRSRSVRARPPTG